MTLTQSIFCAADNVWIRIWPENIDTDWQQSRCLCCLVLFLIHVSFVLHKTSCEPPISPSLHIIRVNLDPAYRFSKLSQQVSPIRMACESEYSAGNLYTQATHICNPPKNSQCKASEQFLAEHRARQQQTTGTRTHAQRTVPRKTGISC